MSRFDECDPSDAEDLAWEAEGDDAGEAIAEHRKHVDELFRRQRGLRERRWAS